LVGFFPLNFSIVYRNTNQKKIMKKISLSATFKISTRKQEAAFKDFGSPSISPGKKPMKLVQSVRNGIFNSERNCLPRFRNLC